MVHEEAGGTGGKFVRHLLHGVVLRLAARVGSEAKPRKNEKATAITEIRLESIDDGLFV